jgi:hypothetical protein
MLVTIPLPPTWLIPEVEISCCCIPGPPMGPPVGNPLLGPPIGPDCCIPWPPSN